MATIQGEYWQFYVQGRCGKLLKNDIDEEALVEDMVSKGTPLRDMILSAASRAAAPLESGKARRDWIKINDDEIKASGGDGDLAYAAYLQGRTDELAYALEHAVVEELGQRWGLDDDEADHGDEDEDDENEEDDE
jgi:hypothetical protein